MEKNNTKLNKIYKILRIILIVLFLFSAMKSCAKAYTWEDLKQYNESINNELTGNIKITSNMFINLQSSLNTYITNQEINLEDYNAFLICSNYYGNGTGNNNTLQIYLYKVGESTTWNNYSSSKILNNPETALKLYYIDAQYQRTWNKTTSVSEAGWQTIKYATAIGLINNNLITNYNNNYYLENKFCYCDILQEPVIINTLPQYFANARVGQSLYNSNISFELYDTSDNFIKYLNANNETNTQGGYIYQLEIPNTSNLINGNYYRVKINDNSSYIFTSEDFKITWENPPQPRRNNKQ